MRLHSIAEVLQLDGFASLSDLLTLLNSRFSLVVFLQRLTVLVDFLDELSQLIRLHPEL